MTTASAIQQGNVVRLQVEFTNEQNELEDPEVVSCQVQSPALQNNIITPEPTKVSKGVYSYLLTVGLPGRWQYRFAGSGGLVAAAESDFWVQNSDLV